MIAAPIAAYMVRHIPGRMLGSLVGGIIIITNARTLMGSFEIDGAPRAAIYVSLFVLWGAAIAISIRGLRQDNAETRRLLDEGIVSDDQGQGRRLHTSPPDPV